MSEALRMCYCSQCKRMTAHEVKPNKEPYTYSFYCMHCNTKYEGLTSVRPKKDLLRAQKKQTKVLPRFLPIEQYKGLAQQLEKANAALQIFVQIHCRDCGDTKPKHGFYPLWSSSNGKNVYVSSGYVCNRCRLTDEEYLQRFGEPKEIFEK